MNLETSKKRTCASFSLAATALKMLYVYVYAL